MNKVLAAGITLCAGLTPGVLWLPTYLGLQQLEHVSPWTAMLISSSAGIVYIRLAALLFRRPLRLPLCFASSTLLILTSYVWSAIVFNVIAGTLPDATLFAAALLGLAASAFGFTIIFAGDTPKKGGSPSEEPPVID